MNTFKRIKTGILASGLALLAHTAVADEIKLAHVGNPGSLYDVSANHFAEVVNARLPEGWSVETYGASQLGDDQELLQKLRLGTVDLALPSSVMSSVDERFGVFELPYITKSRAHVDALRETILPEILVPAARDKGYEVLSMWESGYRHMTNSKRPIASPEDLVGIKIRMSKSPWRVAAFESYGANPTPMAFSEVFVALQTGVVDGQENPISIIYATRFNEVQKYLSLSGHIYAPVYLVAGSSLGKFPEEVQTILREGAEETLAWNLAKSQELEAEQLKLLQDAGMEVNEVDTTAFVEATRAVQNAFAENVEGGRVLIDAVRAAAP
ncbi:TRAP transporter substrate-binding protein [Sulfitobacter sp. W074]|uniref:TRAP transporter substrate-binding protein n=1 Tax=Sulfitobacter sp. W074 TaxID=2867026 RepID=UPI0021A95D7E|nr:TRAP transporter substrate-binding protein [Sulfitobacter sp. W074]UWR38461.1 TRAP transporter substrate-binding protein [Sulfitobacter sp. W074]